VHFCLTGFSFWTYFRVGRIPQKIIKVTGTGFYRLDALLSVNNNVKVLKTFKARTQTRENNPEALYFVDPAPDS